MTKRANKIEGTSAPKEAAKKVSKPSSKATGFSINSTVVAKGTPMPRSLNKMVDRAVKKVAMSPVAAQVSEKKPMEQVKLIEIKPNTVAEENVSADHDHSENVVVNRKRMMEQVAERCGMRPNQVRTIMDAVLAELSDSLLAGKKIKHPDFGTMTVQRRKAFDDGGEMLVCKLRVQQANLAEAAE